MTKIIVDTQDLISVPAAARQLGIHFTTLYRWIKKGDVHTLTVGEQVFITAQDLAALKKEKMDNEGIEERK